jgi:hypothetical protein
MSRHLAFSSLKGFNQFILNGSGFPLSFSVKNCDFILYSAGHTFMPDDYETDGSGLGDGYFYYYGNNQGDGFGTSIETQDAQRFKHSLDTLIFKSVNN